MATQVQAVPINLTDCGLCGKCLHPLRKGCKGHICNQTNLLKNIANLLPEKVKARVANDVLKKKLEDSGNQEVTFSTGGNLSRLVYKRLVI